MATKDLYNGLSPVISLAPAARTASANGTGVDLQGYESALVVVTTGAITDGTHTIEVQESSDNSSFAAVASTDLQGAEPALGESDDNEVHKIGYIGTKRYIRVAVTVAGTTTGGIYSAVVLRGHGRHQPSS